MEKTITKKRHGFTLVEVIVILLIIAILAIYFSTRLPGRGIDLYYQANQLNNFIRLTQQYAISRADKFRIQLRSNGYHIYFTDDITNMTSASDDIVYPTGFSLCGCGTFGVGTCYLMFNTSGMPFVANSSGGFANLTTDFDLKICVAGSAGGRTVRVNKAGGVTIP